MDSSLYCATENFIAFMHGDDDGESLVREIKWIARGEGTTPKAVLWRIEAAVGQKTAEARRTLQKMLDA